MCRETIGVCGGCGAVFDIVGISKFFVGWVL